jgi:hypothetical protein
LAVLTLLGGWAASPADGATGITVQHVPGTSGLRAVACPTETSCVALGSSNNTGGSVVSINNGVAGIPRDVPGTGTLAAVACATATSCEAIGNDGNFASTILVPIVNGVPGAARPDPANGIGFSGMACSSATTCVAVGTITGPNYAQGIVMPITNGIPGAAQYMPDTELVGVSCSSATTCLAVGAHFNHTANGTFSDQAGLILPITSGALGTPQWEPGLALLSAVACPSATTCVAVGGLSQGVGATVTVTNGTPGDPQPVPGSFELQGVACPSATACEAAGTSSTAGPLGYQGVLAFIDNGAPASAQVVAGTAPLSGVACPDASTCYAIGTSGSTPGASIEGVVVTIPALAGGATVTPAPTRLTVAPQIVHGAPWQGAGARFVSAELTSGRAPLAGKGITFSTGGSPVCNATTNGDGTARCRLSSRSEIKVLRANGYEANFAGDADYLASHASTAAIASDRRSRRGHRQVPRRLKSGQAKVAPPRSH